ncbi:ATP-dependent endonuclease [soil metagenome]
MYLSKLLISNYRSIKELSLKFEKGKNIIVGKNNAGKSNIIKAIDLILGEGSPTWHKSDNITENDFFNGQTDNEIYIFCELVRDAAEVLNYAEINKCYGFKILAKRGKYENVDGVKFYSGEPIRQKVVTTSVHDCINTLQAAMDISEQDADGSTIYINSKLKNQVTFEGQFTNKYHFAYGFRAYKDQQDKIKKEIRFFYKEHEDENWVMAFGSSVRNELLQSAIIHSFRDPQNELRINQWSWFGKLLRQYINPSDPDLVAAFKQVNIASNGIFKDMQDEINSPKVKVAFPNTSISFQFNPETKIDVYKSALIYVDDGFNSLLQEKGSGIQSAVIIGLYNYYTNKFAHTSSSLLAVEEPEIYLHPQARRVISNRIDDFLQGNKNQVIITTHSTEFITSAHEDLNMIVVKKEHQKGTEARNTKFDTAKEKQILIKAQNAEMFFADKVILVEGGDKYIVEAIAKFYGANVNPDLGENWLNECNVSVIAVGGKTEFWKYVKKLSELKIPVFVLADFDFFLRQLSEFFTGMDYPKEVHDELNGLRSKISAKKITLAKNILEHIKIFAVSVLIEGVKADEKQIRSSLKEPFRLKRLNQFEEENAKAIIEYLKRLRKINLHILHNELEDYYTKYCHENCKGISGKEEKPIHIVSRLVTEENTIDKFINTDEYLDFLSFVAGAK